MASDSFLADYVHRGFGRLESRWRQAAILQYSQHRRLRILTPAAFHCVQAQRLLQNRMEQHGRYLSALMEGSRRRGFGSRQQPAVTSPPAATGAPSPASALPLAGGGGVEAQQLGTPADQLQTGTPFPADMMLPPVSGGAPSDPSSYQQTHFGPLAPGTSGGLSALASGLAVSPQQQPLQVPHGFAGAAFQRATAPSSVQDVTAFGSMAFDSSGIPGSGGMHPSGFDATAVFQPGNHEMLNIDRHGSSALPLPPDPPGTTKFQSAHAAAAHAGGYAVAPSGAAAAADAATGGGSPPDTSASDGAA